MALTRNENSTAYTTRIGQPGTRRTSSGTELVTLLGQAITTEQLARLLKQYDEDYRAQPRPEGWPDYYAAQLLTWRDAAGA